MLLSVRLVNWTSHTDTVLEFEKGANLLVGVMGSGKSSVFDAVSFALFGSFPALESRKLKLEDIIRFGESRARVELTFLWKDKKYSIIREIEKSKTDARVYEDGRLVEKGQTAVTSYVENLLSVDYDLFTRAIYSEQNNISYFLNLAPAKRREEIDRLLGLDRFERAARGATVVFNMLKKDLDREKTILKEKDESELRECLKEAESELEEIKGELEKEMEELEKTEKILGVRKKDYEEMEKKRKAHAEISSKISSLKGVISALREYEKIKMPNVEELRKRMEETKSKILALREKKSKIQKELNAMQKKAGEIEEKQKRREEILKKISEMEKKIKSLSSGKTREKIEKGLEEDKAKLMECRERIFFLNKKIEEAQASIKTIKGKDICPVCLTKLDEKKQRQIEKEWEEKITRFKKEFSEENKKIAELSERIKENEKTLEMLKEMEKQMEFLRKSIPAVEDGRRIAEEIKKYEKDISLLLEAEEESVGLYSEISEKEKTANEILSKKKELENAKKELEKAEKQIAEIGFEEEKYQKVSVQYQNAKEEYSTLRAVVDGKQKLMKEKKARVEVYKKTIEQIEESKRYIAKIEKVLEDFAVYRNVLAEMQVKLRNELIETINSALVEIWPVVYPYSDYQRARVIADGKDYRFELFSNGRWVEIEKVASGGEKACFAIALRISLAMTLTPNINWLVLDEPTHNLDANAINLLSQAIEKTLPSLIEQFFIITHEESLMGANFTKAYQFRREKTSMDPTVVEEI
ncbi:MAG: SMC family ATPase [Candidatus Anstonellales archaeon]